MRFSKLSIEKLDLFSVESSPTDSTSISSQLELPLFELEPDEFPESIECDGGEGGALA